MNRKIWIKKSFAVIFCVIAVLLCVVVPIVSVNAKEINRNLIVGIPGDNRCPVFYTEKQSGDIAGIGVDLMQAAANEAGYKVSFRKITEKSLKEALDNKEYDIVMPFGNAVPSASGQKTIVSDNLMQTPFTMVTLGNRELPVVNKMRIGMLSSMAAGAESVSRLYPGVDIKLYDTMDESVKALRNNKVDALLHNSYVWSYVLQKPAYSKLKVQPSAMFAMDFRVGALDTPDGRELIESLNKGIEALPETKKQAIILDYTSRDLYMYDFFDYLYLYGAVFAVFIVLSLIEIMRGIALTKANQAAEEASRAKTRFLANMSHEIRTPINSIMGMGELISRESKDEKLRQYAGIITSSSNSLLCLVNDILDFSRMEAGKLKLRNDTYKLSHLIYDVNLMIQDRARSKGLRYEVEVNNDIPDMLIGDETRFKQVLINLLTNGVKYTLEGYVRLSIDFEKVDQSAIDVRVSVRDSGIGLKQEEIEKLFKAFERLDEDRNRSVEGTGLGMSIVKQILDSMGSTLDVKSKYGKGSEFSFVVRQKVADWDKIGDYKMAVEREMIRQSSYRPGFIAPDLKILYVDDTEINIMVLEGLLEKTKVQLDTATSGLQALCLLEDTTYDILLIDHRMPGIDGVELLGRIKNNVANPNHNSVCIALTANVVEGERELCMEAGFDDFLEKPVNGDRLESMLMKYIPEEKRSKEPYVEDHTQRDEASAESDNDSGIPDEIFNKLVMLQDDGYINIEDGIEYAGTQELFLRTLRFFRDSVEKKTNEIEGLYSDGNIDEYSVRVHALKSSAKLIGAYDLSEKARNLELAGKAGELDFIKANNGEMLALYRKYKELLDNI